ncbi:carbon storage regulator [Lentibacillus sediminis]|uniref:carbon storage regulator n=1 Tax=Lentibacillus sediminis TaxID=1940529 RepID=UPI000C1C80A0|nr:carbon storage regulator [Lentibacillus sediminis]
MALTLGRKPGEKVFLVDDQGREVEIEVVSREDKLSNYTQLRISAPRDFQIVRGEIYNSDSK